MAEPFIGQVDLYGFNFAPTHWSRCEGQLLQINDQQAMFSLLGNAYGGDGRSTFALPDLRGRVAVSQGTRPGTTFEYKMGTVVGKETHTLLATQLPKHTHLATFSGDKGNMEFALEATTDVGDTSIPMTGAYRSTAQPPGGGPDKPELMYYTGGNPPESSKVVMGGTLASTTSYHGNVTVGDTGNSNKFSILQTGTIMNYSIAMQGLFPSRS